MKHNLQICVSKEPKTGGVVSCRTKTIREKFLSWLLGKPQKVTILVPGDSVQAVSITEVPDGGESNCGYG